MHAGSNCCDGGNRQQVRVSEDNPQSDPAHGETHVHGIAHVAVEAYDHQALRWRDRRRSPMPRPAKIPNATQSQGDRLRMPGEPGSTGGEAH